MVSPVSKSPHSFTSLDQSFRRASSPDAKFWRGGTLEQLQALQEEVSALDRDLPVHERVRYLFLLKEMDTQISRKIDGLSYTCHPRPGKLCQKQIQQVIARDLGEMLNINGIEDEMGVKYSMNIERGEMSTQEKTMAPFFSLDEKNIGAAYSRVQQGVSDMTRFLGENPQALSFCIEREEGKCTQRRSDGTDPVEELSKFFEAVPGFDTHGHYKELQEQFPSLSPGDIRKIYLDKDSTDESELSEEEQKIVLAKHTLTYLSVSMVGILAMSLGPSGSTLKHSDRVAVSVFYDLSNKEIKTLLREEGATISYTSVTRPSVFLADIEASSIPLKDDSMVTGRLRS